MADRSKPDRKPRLRRRRSSTRPSARKLTEQFGYKNAMQVPVITKIVLNMGIGEGVNDRKKVDNAADDLTPDRRPEGDHHQVAQVDRDLQAARRPGRSAARSRCARRACTNSSTAWSTSRCRACATSAGSIRRASTAAATTRWASRSTSFSRRSTYDKVDRCLGHGHHRLHDGAHRRRSARAARRHSTSPSGSESESFQTRTPGAPDGEEEFDREEQAAPQDGEAIGGRRARLKAIVMDKTKPMEERFAATLKLAELPRNSAQRASAIAAR